MAGVQGRMRTDAVWTSLRGSDSGKGDSVSWPQRVVQSCPEHCSDLSKVISKSKDTQSLLHSLQVLVGVCAAREQRRGLGVSGRYSTPELVTHFLKRPSRNTFYSVTPSFKKQYLPWLKVSISYSHLLKKKLLLLVTHQNDFMIY